MRAWKTALLLAALLLVVFLLYPRRRLSPTEAQRAEVVEIAYMGPGGLEAGAILDAIKAFEKWSEERHVREPDKPRYRIVAGQNANRDMVSDPTRFLVATAGGAPPDVVFFDRFAVSEWASRGAFLPLDELRAGDEAAFRAGKLDIQPISGERFFSAAWREAHYEGRLYGVPNSIDNRALYYNEDLLVRAGLVKDPAAPVKEARPPRTWRELREYAYELTEWEPEKPSRPKSWDHRRDFAFHQELRRAGWDLAKLERELNAEEEAYARAAAQWSARRKLVRAGFIPNFGNSWLYMFAWLNGADPEDEDRSKPRMFMSWDGRSCTLDDPRVVEALQYMKDLYDDLGGWKEVAAYTSGFQRAELDPFITGRVVMKIDGEWVLNHLAQFGRDLNFGVAPSPRPEACADRPLSWIGGWVYAIPINARHPEGAWEFIRFMISDRALRIRNQAYREIAESQGRLFIPSQSPVKEVNELLAREFVYENPAMPEKFKRALRQFNDLLPRSMYRPVTPVGQRLWNEHVSAMQRACDPDRDGNPTPREALIFGAQEVQRWLDQHAAPRGTPIESWNWFFVLYGALLTLLAAAVFLYDTKLEFRRRLARLLRIGGAKAEAVVEGSRGGYLRRQWLGGYVCASPWLIGFLVFGGGPLLFSLVISLCDYNILKAPRYIGAENFRYLFTSDERFWKSLGNTVFMLLGVPLGMIVGLSMALLLNLKIRGMAVWRTFFYLPAIVPMVAASVLWLWILNPHLGVLNKFLDPILGWISSAAGWLLRRDLNFQAPLWLNDANWSKPALILMGLWSAGSSMIIWLAGLKAIDPGLYEAAEVDGANRWQKLRHITIPQLTPYIFLNLVMGLIGTFQIFGQAFLMTQGDPKESTLFYVYQLFNSAFRFGHMGYASAMAWVLFLILLALTLFQLKLAKHWVHYEVE